MKTRVLLLLTAGLLMVLSSCEKSSSSIYPSSTITTETRRANPFDGIDVSTTFKVFVSYSDTVESIEIRANENMHRYIDVVEQGGDLEIKLKDGVNVSGGNLVLEAYITTAFCSDFAISEAASVLLQNELRTSEVYIYLSDVSSFNGEISTAELYCDLSGASISSISGYATSTNLDVSDASSFRDFALATDYLEADISDASEVYITVNETFNAYLSDASYMYYKGNGSDDNSETSGGSSIIKVD